MRLLKACAAAAVIGSAVNVASAALLVGDGFDYTAGALSGNTNTDFASNPAKWNFAGVAGQTGPLVAAGNTVYTGPGALPAFTGANSGQVNAVDGSATRIQLATPAANGIFSQVNNAGTSLYYSFTMSVSDISKLSTGVVGSFVAGFNNAVGAGGAPTADAGVLCANRDSVTATTFHLGVAQQQATGRTFSANQYSQNDPLFVVVAYNFGATPASDTSDLYVFDSAANAGLGDTIPGSQPATPTAHGAYTAEINGSIDSIQSFFLRDNTGAMTAAVDDVRVGTTWVDVAPEPASLALLGISAVGLMGRRRKAR